MTEAIQNIEVAIITDDPFFTHVAYSLIGKDRKTRIWGVASTFDELQNEITNSNKINVFDILICDLDSILQSCDIEREIQDFRKDNKSPKILCLCEGTLNQINNDSYTFSRLDVDGLVAKSDLDYCLHLAIHSLYQNDITLTSSKTSQIFSHRKNLCVMGRTRGHPDINEAVWNVALLRIFVGLDNPDISDELVHAEQTVRAYMTKTYKAFRDEEEEINHIENNSVTSNNFDDETQPAFPIPKRKHSRKALERQAFENISNWWWEERFAFVATKK